MSKRPRPQAKTGTCSLQWSRLSWVCRSGQDPKPRPGLAAYSGADYRGLYGRGYVTNYENLLLNKGYRSNRDLEPMQELAAYSRAGHCRGRQDYPSGADFWTNGCTDRGCRSAQDLAPGECRGGQKYQVIEVPKISCLESAEVVKSTLQERSPERRCEQSETKTSSQELDEKGREGENPSIFVAVC